MEKLSRRKARENAFIALFSASFGSELKEIVELGREEEAEQAVDSYGEMLLRQYAEHAQEVDEAIEARLKGWKTNRLSRVSLALLRLAVTEMKYSEEDMDSIVINETVELSKKYGDEGDYQFINGVLGNISRSTGEEGNVLAPEEQEKSEG